MKLTHRHKVHIWRKSCRSVSQSVSHGHVVCLDPIYPPNTPQVLWWEVAFETFWSPERRVQTVARCQRDDKAPDSSLPLTEDPTGSALGVQRLSIPSLLFGRNRNACLSSRCLFPSSPLQWKGESVAGVGISHPVSPGRPIKAGGEVHVSQPQRNLAIRGRASRRLRLTPCVCRRDEK